MKSLDWLRSIDIAKERISKSEKNNIDSNYLKGSTERIIEKKTVSMTCGTISRDLKYM